MSATRPAVHKRSVVIGGHKTSISLEEAFWREVRDIAHGRNISVSVLLREIDANRVTTNLSSAIRVYVLEHVRAQTDAVHRRHALSA